MREVIVKFKAYKEMVKYFSQFSSNLLPREKWVESMGFLFCNVEGDYYFVEDAIGMTSGSELDVQLSPQSLGNLPELERKHGGFTGGWWHTHPGLSPFFSETDIKNQVFYQAINEDGLGIVWDHSMIDGEYIGFQIFRLIHQFSEEYVEVPFQLQGFTEEGIKECMNLLGISDEITIALIEKYGKGGVQIKIDFSKLGDYLGDDPIGDSEWTLMDAEELLKQDKIIDVIKHYKMAANMLSENEEHTERFAEVLFDLIQLCIINNYLENAKEEYELLKSTRGKISEELYTKYSSTINANLEDQ